MKCLYQQMIEKAAEYSLPKSFTKDLFEHDLRWVREEFTRGRAFGWTLGICGTHILDIRMSRGSLTGYLEFFAANGADTHFFVAKDGILTEYDFDGFGKVLFDEMGERWGRIPH